nr:MAG TPA: HOLLIDAY JUNCTION RESOLVASE [Caudoviricetes sp.]
MRAMILDPGESTGYLCVDLEGDEYEIYTGGTLPKDHYKVFSKIRELHPDLLIYETFHMYPGKAKSLSWNSFYPCEVIGVIKLTATTANIKQVVELAPSTKKYAGGFDNPIWISFRKTHEYTEHTKDTWLLFQYWYRNKYKKRTG